MFHFYSHSLSVLTAKFYGCRQKRHVDQKRKKNSNIGAASINTLFLFPYMLAMGMGLCVAFIAFVRLPSLKVSTLLLTGLLIYDVFWVFFSSYLFNANVMVKVGTFCQFVNNGHVTYLAWYHLFVIVALSCQFFLTISSCVVELVFFTG